MGRLGRGDDGETGRRETGRPERMGRMEMTEMTGRPWTVDCRLWTSDENLIDLILIENEKNNIGPDAGFDHRFLSDGSQKTS